MNDVPKPKEFILNNESADQEIGDALNATGLGNVIVTETSEVFDRMLEIYDLKEKSSQPDL